MPNPLLKTRLTPKFELVVFSQLRFSLPKEDCPTPGTIVPPKLYPSVKLKAFAKAKFGIFEFPSFPQEPLIFK